MVNPIWSRRLSDTYLLECLDSSIKHKTQKLIDKESMVYQLRLMNSTRSTLKSGDPFLRMLIEQHEYDIMRLKEDIEFLDKQIDLIRGRLEDESTK